MAMEQTTTTIDDSSNSGSDLVRKIVAAVVGLIIIIAIVLLAKWLGDLIRARFITTKTPAVTTTKTTDTSTSNNDNPSYDPKTGTYKISTISAIPSTGPNDGMYLAIAGMGLAGVVVLTFSKKISLQ